MQRKLASIQKIKNVLPHPNADKLEVYEVLGWKVLDKIGSYKVGDYVIYCEMDSIFPKTEQWAWMESFNYRIKFRKLRGIRSEGLLLPISILGHTKALNPFTFEPENLLEEGLDVTSLLEITKWEPEPEDLLKKGPEIKGNFPYFCRKSDEIRMQSVMPGICDEFHGKKCYITTKCDGSSVSFYTVNDSIGCCSRNYEINLDTESKHSFIFEKYHLKYKLKSLNLLGFNLQFIGELCGPGIQKK